MSKKGTKALASATLMSLVLTTALSAGPVKAAAGSVTRVGEVDRYATAAKVATTNWTTSDNVVLVSGEGYADAVSASALAKKLNAPILLTTAGSLNSDTKAALNTLKAKNVYVVGGNASVSAAVRADLKANYSLVELGGANRYETNAAVAQKLVDLGVDPSNVIMVGGEGFSDALSVAPVAAAKGQILLLGMNDANYMKPVIDFVKKHNSKVTVVGTKNVISEAIYSAVNAVSRVDGGQDRFDTNLKVLAAFKDTVKMDKMFVANASGNGYADALVASALAGTSAAPLVLVDGETAAATSNAIAYIKANATEKTDLNVVGGTGVVSNATVDAINNAVKPTTPVFTGEITSVEAVADQTVNANSNTEVLKFTVNGGRTASIDDIINAGYSITFNTDKTVFEGTGDEAKTSKTGELDKTNMKDLYDNQGKDSFKYQVVITKDDVVVASSDFIKVNLIKGDVTASTITNYTMKHVTGSITTRAADNSGALTTKITSGKLVEGEQAYVSEVKGDTVDGKHDVTLTDNLKFYSSDPFIASVDESTGVITANNEGSFTLTIKSGTQSKTISMSVVKDSRKVKSVSANTSSVKLGKGATATIELTFKDQYGDTIKSNYCADTTSNGNDYKFSSIKNSNGDVIATVSDAAPTNNDGKAKITISTEDITKTGSGTLKVSNNDGATLLSIPVSTNATTLVDNYKLQAVNDGKSSDLTIDLNQQAASDNDNEYVKLQLNQFAADGTSLGKSEGSGFRFFVTQDTTNQIMESSDKKVELNLNGDKELVVATPFAAYDNDDLNATANSLTKLPEITTGGSLKVASTGTLTVTAEKDGIIKSSVKITVKDSSPKISGVKFQGNIEAIYNGGGVDLTSIVKAEDISISGSAGDGKVRIAENGAVFINYKDGGNNTANNVESGDPAYNDDTDILLGYIVAKPENTSDVLSTTISNGKLTWNMNGTSDSGTIIVGIQRPHDKTPAYTTKVTLDSN